jgi:hypothetical protein
LLQDNYAFKFTHINTMPLTFSGKYLKYAYEINDPGKLLFNPGDIAKRIERPIVG